MCTVGDNSSNHLTSTTAMTTITTTTNRMSLIEACNRLQNNDPSLLRLDLSNEPLGDAGMIRLCEALRHNSQLQELHLGNVGVTAVGMIPLATDVLPGHTGTALQRLFLQSNYLGDEGCERLAAGIAANTSLQLLNLARNCIGNVGAAALAEALIAQSQNQLQTVQQQQTQQNLSRLLPKQSPVNISFDTHDGNSNDVNFPAAPAQKQKQQQNSHYFHKLYLYENNIGNVGAAALAEMMMHTAEHLQELFLWENPPLGCEGLQELAAAQDYIVKQYHSQKLQLKTNWNSNNSSCGSPRAVTTPVQRHVSSSTYAQQQQEQHTNSTMDPSAIKASSKNLSDNHDYLPTQEIISSSFTFASLRAKAEAFVATSTAVANNNNTKTLVKINTIAKSTQIPQRCAKDNISSTSSVGSTRSLPVRWELPVTPGRDTEENKVEEEPQEGTGGYLATNLAALHAKEAQRRLQEQKQQEQQSIPLSRNLTLLDVSSSSSHPVLISAPTTTFLTTNKEEKEKNDAGESPLVSEGPSLHQPDDADYELDQDDVEKDATTLAPVDDCIRMQGVEVFLAHPSAADTPGNDRHGREVASDRSQLSETEISSAKLEDSNSSCACSADDDPVTMSDCILSPGLSSHTTVADKDQASSSSENIRQSKSKHDNNEKHSSPSKSKSKRVRSTSPRIVSPRSRKGKSRHSGERKGKQGESKRTKKIISDETQMSIQTAIGFAVKEERASVRDAVVECCSSDAQKNQTMASGSLHSLVSSKPLQNPDFENQKSPKNKSYGSGATKPDGNKLQGRSQMQIDERGIAQGHSECKEIDLAQAPLVPPNGRLSNDNGNSARGERTQVAGFEKECQLTKMDYDTSPSSKSTAKTVSSSSTNTATTAAKEGEEKKRERRKVAKAAAREKKTKIDKSDMAQAAAKGVERKSQTLSHSKIDAKSGIQMHERQDAEQTYAKEEKKAHERSITKDMEKAGDDETEMIKVPQAAGNEARSKMQKNYIAKEAAKAGEKKREMKDVAKATAKAAAKKRQKKEIARCAAKEGERKNQKKAVAKSAARAARTKGMDDKSDSEESTKSLQHSRKSSSKSLNYQPTISSPRTQRARSSEIIENEKSGPALPVSSEAPSTRNDCKCSEEKETPSRAKTPGRETSLLSLPTVIPSTLSSLSPTPLGSASPVKLSIVSKAQNVDGNPSLFRVTIPENVLPGDEFRVCAGNIIAKIKCPPMCRPNQVLQFKVPLDPSRKKIAPAETQTDASTGASSSGFDYFNVSEQSNLKVAEEMTSPATQRKASLVELEDDSTDSAARKLSLKSISRMDKQAKDHVARHERPSDSLDEPRTRKESIRNPQNSCQDGVEYGQVLRSPASSKLQRRSRSRSRKEISRRSDTGEPDVQRGETEILRTNHKLRSLSGRHERLVTSKLSDEKKQSILGADNSPIGRSDAMPSDNRSLPMNSVLEGGNDKIRPVAKRNRTPQSALSAKAVQLAEWKGLDGDTSDTDSVEEPALDYSLPSHMKSPTCSALKVRTDGKSFNAGGAELRGTEWIEPAKLKPQFNQTEECDTPKPNAQALTSSLGMNVKQPNAKQNQSVKVRASSLKKMRSRATGATDIEKSLAVKRGKAEVCSSLTKLNAAKSTRQEKKSYNGAAAVFPMDEADDEFSFNTMCGNALALDADMAKTTDSRPKENDEKQTGFAALRAKVAAFVSPSKHRRGLDLAALASEEKLLDAPTSWVSEDHEEDFSFLALRTKMGKVSPISTQTSRISQGNEADFSLLALKDEMATVQQTSSQRALGSNIKNMTVDGQRQKSTSAEKMQAAINKPKHASVVSKLAGRGALTVETNLAVKRGKAEVLSKLKKRQQTTFDRPKSAEVDFTASPKRPAKS